LAEKFAVIEFHLHIPIIIWRGFCSIHACLQQLQRWIPTGNKKLVEGYFCN